jgi:pSer/pThr/pTyr-binding forkhead associated (FHA) protein
MALTLAVCGDDSGELPEITFDLPRLSIGRAESCDLRLPDLSVSQHHASIRQRGRDYVILDEGSSNGTFVGPVRLAPQAPRVLLSGERVRFGRIWVEVRFEAVTATPHLQLAIKDLALQLVAKHLLAQGEVPIPKLTVIVGQNAGTVLVLEKADRRYLLGRSSNADLVITDVNASRRQAEVWRKDAQVFVRDLGSKNGSTLNGVFIYPDKTLPWPHGAFLGIGATRVVLSDPTSEAMRELFDGADDHLSDQDQGDLAATCPPPRQDPGPVRAVKVGNTPTAPGPRPAPKKPRSARGRTITADASVAILALAVLGASLLGLLWMLGGK